MTGLGDEPGALGLRRIEGDLAFVVALAGLPGMGPMRLRRVLSAVAAPDAWASILGGRFDPRLLEEDRSPQALAGVVERWRTSAHGGANPYRVISQMSVNGARAHVIGDRSYPRMLLDEPTAPVVCFTLGERLAEVTGDEVARVALVGTRSSTHYGEELAAEVGSGLSAAGVVVVSGLALGIDAAAHEGALRAQGSGTALAIVGSGLDVVYPRSNERLWRRVGEQGVLLSEAPPGTRPERWRFPLRNRLVAAASDLVVVVESHHSGGAMHTVQSAYARGVPVAAIPGSVRSPASRGSNALIAAGASLVTDADDVLALLAARRDGARLTRWCGAPSERRSRRSSARSDADEAVVRASDPRPRSSTEAAVLDAVLAAIGEEGAGLEAVLERTGRGIGDVSLALEALVATGRARRVPGGYVRGR